MKKLILVLAVISLSTACKRDRKSLEVTDITPVDLGTPGGNDDQNQGGGNNLFKWDGRSDVSLGGLSIENK